MDQGAKEALALHIELITIDRHNRDIATGPIVLFQHLSAGHDVLSDLLRLGHALLFWLKELLDRLKILILLNLVFAVDPERPVANVLKQDDGAVNLVPLPPLGHHDLVFGAPWLRNRGPCIIVPIDRSGIAVLCLELRLGQTVHDKCRVPVAAIRLRGIWIAVDRKRVDDPLDHDVHVERVVKGVVEADAPVAETTRHGALDACVICNVCRRRVFDIADQPVDDLGSLGVRATIDRVHLDRRLVHARVVHHLPDEGGQLVDGEARTPITLALLQDALRPLFIQARKPDIIQRGSAVVIGSVGRLGKGVLGFFQNVVSHQPIHPPAP